MKVRGTTAGTPFGAKLTALCWGALTLLAPVAVSACTSGSSSSPTIISPTVTSSPTGTASASSGSSASAGSSASSGASDSSGTPGVSSGAASAASSPQPGVTVTQTVTVPPSSQVPSSQVPSGAPVTGGGGTAGFQGLLLLVLGAGAILAGAGGLAYRRWLARGR
jgi:hypothetical protein